MRGTLPASGRGLPADTSCHAASPVHGAAQLAASPSCRLGPRKADGIWTNSIVLVQPHGVTGGTGSLRANPRAGALIADVPCSRWAASPRGVLAPILRTAVFWSFLFLFPAVAWKHLRVYFLYFNLWHIIRRDALITHNRPPRADHSRR